jgi:large subunit ribosomal protein L10
MNKQEKAEEVESLRQALKDGPSAFVVAFEGLNVGQVSHLRMKVRGTSSHYRVVKNRLALRVMKETPLDPLAAHFHGPTAIAYSDRDPASLAKVLNEFSKEHQGLKLKAGWVDGRVVGPLEIKVLADLPSREALVAQLLRVLNGPVTGFLRVLQGPARQMVRVLDQIAKSRKDAAGEAATIGAEAPPQT